jgi:hypothetical protein
MHKQCVTAKTRVLRMHAEGNQNKRTDKAKSVIQEIQTRTRSYNMDNTTSESATESKPKKRGVPKVQKEVQPETQEVEKDTCLKAPS